MTPHQITLVQDSFRHIILIRESASALFYERLFAIDPDLRAMFSSTDMPKQGAKLMHALAFVVHGLSKPDTMLPAVRELGRRHVHYGVKEDHYQTVGQAFLETLATGLGTDFTTEVREAWQAAYGLIASTMIAAAGDESLAA